MTGIQHVQPGDLIRADMINTIIDAIADLQADVAGLGGSAATGSGVAITSISPVPATMGDVVTISGRNFGWSDGTLRLFVAGSQVGYRSGTSNTQVLFVMPDFSGFSPTGQNVHVEVENATSSDAVDLLVQPRPVVPSGQIDIDFVDASPTPITTGESAFIHFQLRSRESNLPATMTLTPTVSTGWAGLQILSSLSPPVVQPTLTVQPLATVDFWVEVPVPSVPQDTPFVVRVTGAGQGFSSDSGDQHLTVGHAVTPQASYIEFDGSVAPISLAKGATSIFTFATAVQQTGDYAVTVTTDPAPSTPPKNTDWTLDTSEIPAGAQSVQSLPTGGPRPGVAVLGPWDIGVTAPAATPSGTVELVLTAQKSGDTVDRELRIQLVVTG